MDMKELDSSSEDSLGSEEDDTNYNGGGGGDTAGASDSLLDSSDDTDSDPDVEGEGMEVDEDALLEELSQINDQLAANPYAYELYGEKIKILKKIGDLERLRETREKFSELYPLSEELWLDWLRDEVKLACTDEEKDALLELFDRAVTDYLSVDVWLEYINFCISRMGEENGVEKCREVFERALGSCGLHVSMGSVVWDMYRDFEAALLGSAKNEEQQNAQENRYMALCKRQLSVPILGMNGVYEDLKSKIDLDENTQSSYKKALERLNGLEIWESKLVQPGDNKTEIYKAYIEEEKKLKSNPARIQCLYERAIAASPLDSTVWLEYLDYLSKNLKIEDIIVSTAARASRNCSWDVNVWIKYMNLTEEFCVSQVFEDMKSVFEKAIMYLGSSGETAGTIWLKYLEFLRRKVGQLGLENDTAKDQLEILRKTFVAAEQHLLQLLPEPNEYVSEILLFRLRFEIQCAKSINEEASNVWKDILSRGYGQYAKTWLQYILQQITYGEGDVKKVRAIYGKAVSYVQDDPSTICNLWINFERDKGDLSSIQQCESKISAQMAKNAAAAALVSLDDGGTAIDRKHQQGKGNSSTTVSNIRKRKLNETDDITTTYQKKGKRTEDTVDSDNTNSVFKVPSLPAPNNATKKNVGDVKNANKSSSGSTSQHHGELIRHDPTKDNRTVFLSNLAYTTSEEEIKTFFTEVGNVEDIRLAKDFKGRSKGFGYVCFSTINEARAALSKDRQPINGRPAFVSKCDPDKSTRQKQFKYSTNLEKNKLFIKGLPFSLSVDGLKDIFKDHGDIKDCRLVTFRNGHSKGLAYVEFIDQSSAQQAILKTDGMMIGDKKISVALSNPPSRDSSKSVFQSSFKSSSSTDNTQRRAPRAFVPRSLQLSAAKKEDVNKPAQPSGPKSNDDFRKMFMKS